MKTTTHFLLIGNGLYLNRGCEAIVRGTMAVLRRAFGDSIQATVAAFGDRQSIARQDAAEIDRAIRHIALPQPGARWSRDWFFRQLDRMTAMKASPGFVPRPGQYKELDDALARADVVMQIGGDNYSLDYGWPERFLALDSHIQRQGRSIVLWGASVGPFDTVPEAAQRVMYSHLATFRALLVRESESLDCLTRHAVQNVFRVSDPAFAMQAVKPEASRIGFPLSAKRMIGLNFSPLMARYVTGGNLEQWIKICADLVTHIAAATPHRILLIPHVTSTVPAKDDFVLLQRILEQLHSARDRVQCLPADLAAAEIKWVISQCSIFMGARTHATIAALSSSVPTISLAYSRKAFGLNQDLFGSQQYCLRPNELLTPDQVATHVASTLSQADKISKDLRRKIPAVTDGAYAAGMLLRDMLASDEKTRPASIR